MALIKQFSFNIFQERTALASIDGTECVVVDPGFYTPEEEQEFFSFIDNNGLKPQAVLVTHCHFDHIFGVARVQRRFNIPVYMDDREQACFKANWRMIDTLGLRSPDLSFTWNAVSERQVINAAGFEFEVISTPGHSPGGVCFLDRKEKLMFTGDTLFAGTIGRTDLPGSDYDKEILSIMEKIIVLDPDIQFFPGHGPGSTIGRERTHNPFLEPFNEPEEPFDPDAEPVIISGLQE